MESNLIFTLHQQFSTLFLGALRGYYGVGSYSDRGAGKWFWYEVVVGEND